jgi:hypothetical protein
MNMFWAPLARLLARPRIADYLIRRSQRTPYFNIDGYMDRFWLFNAYRKNARGVMYTRWPRWIPSVRVHHILRADLDTVPHDHPWNARTIILRGWYFETRQPIGQPNGFGQQFVRKAGSTATLKFEEYHAVQRVSKGGVWTLFFTWKYRGGWGFWVGGKKVPYREYLARKLP